VASLGGVVVGGGSRGVVVMSKPVPGKGMKRFVFHGGALHVLADPEHLVIQVRTPDVNTTEDAGGLCAKLGVVLGRKESFALLKTLVEVLSEMKL